MAEQLLAGTTVCISNKASEPCCICLENMGLGARVSMLRCGHRMHGPCLRRWFLGKATAVCPLCKQASTPGS